ncbi:hypothetical protein ISN44_As13g011680, partial [Arabidopsis suecica]
MDVDGSTVVSVVIVGIPVAGGESFIPELRLEHEIVVFVGMCNIYHLRLSFSLIIIVFDIS